MEISIKNLNLIINYGNYFTSCMQQSFIVSFFANFFHLCIIHISITVCRDSDSVTKKSYRYERCCPTKECFLSITGINDNEVDVSDRSVPPKQLYKAARDYIDKK